MSLKDLGKIKKVFDMFNDNPFFAKGGKKNDIQVFAKSILGEMDIDKAISGFQKLGVEGDNLIDILIKCGFDTDEVKGKISKLGSSGSKSVVGLKDAFSGLLTVMKPVLATVGSLMVAFAGYKLFDYLIHTIDRMDESLASLKDELASVEEELSGLETGSKTVEKRLAELYALQKNGPLTFTEEEELRNLEAQNRELARKIELLKMERDLKQSEINRTFTETMAGDLNSQHISKDNVFGYDVKVQDGMEVISPVYDTEINYIEKQFDKYKENLSKIAKEEESYKQQIADAKKAGDEARAKELLEEQKRSTEAYEDENKKILAYLDEKKLSFEARSSGLSYIKGDSLTAEQQEFNKQLAYIEDFIDRRAIILGSDNAKTNAFNRIVDTEFDDATKGLKELGKEGAVTAEMLKDPAYSEFVDKCISLGVVSDASTESLNFLALGFNNLTNAASGSGAGLSGTTTAIDLINQSIDGVQSKISSLGDSLTKLRDGSLTLEEVIDLIQEFPELADYVDLTSESFGDLDKGLQKLIRHAPDKLIDELRDFKKTADLTEKQRDAIDDLCVSMEKLSTEAITDASEEFGILAEAISASKRAKTELDKALSEDDYDANFEDRIEAFEGMQEVLKNGEVGSKAFNAYKEYFNIEHLDAAGVKQWVKDNEKYLKDGQNGVKAFMKEIERLNNAGILSEDIAFFDGATNTFGYDITQIEYLGELFGWSGEMFQDFVGKYRMYSEDFVDRTTEMTQKELLLRDILKDLGGVTVASMEDLQDYTGYTEEGVKNLVAEMNALNDAVTSELAAISEGGNVNLNLRPQIDTSELLAAGWDEEIVGEAGNIATVFSSTFSNAAGNVAINFTPIQVDKNGNYIGVLDPTTFEQYCQDVVDGVREDDLNLQIGAAYTGRDAVKQAEIDAIRVHELHEMLRASGEIKILGVDDINITQSIVDSMHTALGSVEEVKAALVDLGNTDGVTFDAEVTYNGQSIHDILAEGNAAAEDAVSVDIKMTVNNEEVIASVRSTATQLEQILGKDWQIKLDSADAEEKTEIVGSLLENISDPPTTVTVNGKTYNAVNGLKGVLDLIRDVQANSVITVTTNHVSTGAKYVPTAEQRSSSAYWSQFYASGTRSAEAGPALLGDEYSPNGEPKPELVVSNGGAFIAGQNGPEIVNLSEGAQVYPANETKKILNGNPSARRMVIPAFATGAGGYSAGSLAENMYLEGRISATKEWLNEQEAKKKAEAAAKQKAAAQKKEAQTSGTSAYWESQKTAPTVPVKATKYTEGLAGGTASLNGGTGGGSGGSGGGSGSYGSSSSTEKQKSQFELDYEYHQHLLAMEKEDYADYIEWLEKAYQEAYAQGQIELEDYRKYMEEVFNGQKELFQDSIEDIEHKIKALEREPGNEQQIVNYYNQIIAKIDAEIAAARARGLDDDDDYIQELVEQKWDYADEIADVQEEIKENAMDAVEDLIDYRIDMLKQDIENEKDAANDKLDTLRDFYDKQKEMLQDVYDEEKYLEEQSEKRKSVSDIEAELDMIKFDDSAKAEKRRKELEEELKEAKKDLADFEKDHAFENATDLLDKMYEQQEKQIQSELDALDEKLNNPNALYNQALRDIQNNTLALYEEMLEYNRKHGDGRDSTVYDMWSEADKSLDAYFSAMGEAYKNILLVDAYKPTGYASGTSHASPGVHELFEGNNDEYVFTTKSGHKYRMFSGLGDKVLNASATDFLYKFANNGEAFISNMISGLVGSIGNVGKPAQQIQLSTGDIIIQGNTTQETVSAIRRAQRENVDHILREFTRLNR